MNSKDGIDFVKLSTLRESRRIQIRRCQGIAVRIYSVTLDALTLKPSDFCDVGVNQAPGAPPPPWRATNPRVLSPVAEGVPAIWAR